MPRRRNKRYKPVSSSWIDGIKQETAKSGRSVVRMRTEEGAVYEYPGTIRKFTNWCKSASKGKYFHRAVKGSMIRRLY